MKKQQEKGPLQSLKVLDFSNHVSGAMCTSMLADFGAEVIKIERPGVGDTLRSWPPYKEGVPLFWLVHSRNKKSITLNLKSSTGREIIQQLVEKKGYEIIVENFRPGVMEKLQLGYEDLKTINPRLIMTRLTGFGQEGPYSKKPGFGTIAEAMSGYTYISGFPEKPPLSPPIALADEISGLFATIALMFAIYHRDVQGTDEGQYIDVSLYEPLFRMIIPQVIQYDQMGTIKERLGNRHQNTAPRNIYKSSDDKWLALSASTQTIFERACKAIGREELINDDRFKDNQSRIENVEELDKIIGDWMAQHPQDEIIKTFEEAQSVIGPVYDISQIMDDPHVKFRENIISLLHSKLGEVKMQSVVPHFSKTPGQVHQPGPELGEHNEELFTEVLHYSREEFLQLKENNII